MRKIILLILLPIFLLTTLSCDHNVYLDDLNIWQVQDQYFKTANEAINYLIESQQSKDIGQDRTIYLLQHVLARGSDGVAEYGKMYVRNESFRQGITVPKEFEGTLCIDFKGHRYDFANNATSFFRIEGGSEISICNGKTVIFDEASHEPYALVIGTRTVTIDDHLIDDRRKDNNPAVKVTSDGALEVTGSRAATGLNGTFFLEENADVTINEGTITILDITETGNLVITAGEIHNPHSIEQRISEAISEENKENVARVIIHTPLTRVPAKEPTCTEEGNYEYYICSCDEWFWEPEAKNLIKDHNLVVRKKLKHVLKHYEFTDSTCTSEGYKEHWECERCDRLFEDYLAQNQTTSEALRIPKKPHQFVEGWSSDESRHWHECSVCHTHDEETIGAHSWNEGVVIKGATSHSDGIKRFTCTVCGRIWDKAIPAHDHVYGEEHVVDPTCTEMGYTWHQCTLETCQQITIIPDSYVDPYLHEGTITHYAKHDADCEHDGNIEYWHCTRCDGYSDNSKFTHLIQQEDTVLEALGHDFKTIYSYDQTQHWRECRRCDVTTDVGDHDKIYSADDDYHWWQCSVCEYADYNKEAHSWVKIGDTYYCTICGTERSEEEMETDSGFDVEYIDPIPKGYLKCEESSDGRTWNITLISTNENAVPTQISWYVDFVLKDSSNKFNFTFNPDFSTTYEIYCEFQTSSGNFGSASETIYTFLK